LHETNQYNKPEPEKEDRMLRRDNEGVVATKKLPNDEIPK